MAISYLLSLAICVIIFPHSFNASTPTQQVGQEIQRNLNVSGRRRLNAPGCADKINPIDECSGLCVDDWMHDRHKLAGCAVGYGKHALGGHGGVFYVVVSNLDLDAVNPAPGTLRHAVLQDGPVWIVFQTSMTITLKEELIVTSFKTIDGRGVNVKLTGCSGIMVQDVTNIIIHGITITGMRPCGDADVRSSSQHSGHRAMSDGDAITVFGSKEVWINHCTLSNCADGLVDVVMASTDVTISNCHFSEHNETMLLGHNDGYTADKNMRVTVAYNHFAHGLIQRLPRARYCTVDLVNNFYSDGWGIYAVGGTSNPIINSKGNIYTASNNEYTKEVTYHVNEGFETWKNYNWNSENDLLRNGATFHATGHSSDNVKDVEILPAAHVEAITAYAGALQY